MPHSFIRTVLLYSNIIDHTVIDNNPLMNHAIISADLGLVWFHQRANYHFPSSKFDYFLFGEVHELQISQHSKLQITLHYKCFYVQFNDKCIVNGLSGTRHWTIWQARVITYLLAASGIKWLTVLLK